MLANNERSCKNLKCESDEYIKSREYSELNEEGSLNWNEDFNSERRGFWGVAVKLVGTLF